MYTKPMRLSRKIIEDIPVNPIAAKFPDTFGVEIELEGRNLKTMDPTVNEYYTIHADGSLRIHHPGADALEYVFRHPLTHLQTHDALKALFKHLTSPGVEVFQSYRTSIHVHVNYAAERMIDVYNAMVLSVIFDELFVSQNGSHRIGNNFCLRSRDAQGQINEIIQSTENNGNFYMLNGHNRYSAINFVSLMKFGSIEYRSLECTTDFNRVMHWVDTLHRIRAVSRTFKNPKEIISQFSKLSPKDFLFFCLGPQAVKYSQVPDFAQMLRNGMRLAQDLAFCSDWREATAEDKPEPKKKKGLGRLPGGPPVDWPMQPNVDINPWANAVLNNPNEDEEFEP